MEFGITMFGDLAYNSITGQRQNPQVRMQEMLEEAKLADEVGLHMFGMGEHHREDYAVPSPQMFLSAAAAITKNIKLSSAVTVLSSTDPVRLYQEFSMLDNISNGRAEIMVGRGSFIESFPLFGFNVQDYNGLFEEKLELLLKINESNKDIDWRGTYRAPLINQSVFPTAVNQHIPIWVAVGGTPESVVRAARLGLPITFAIIGGLPAHFQPLVAMYKEVYDKYNHPKDKYQLAINSHLLIGENSSALKDYYFPIYAQQMDAIGKDRGWPKFSRQVFDNTARPEGAYFFGSPNEVVDKILAQHELFNHTRFQGHVDVGGPDHKTIMKSIELLGTKVMPEVNKALGN